MLQSVKIGVHPINWCNDDMTDILLGDHYLSLIHI